MSRYFNELEQKDLFENTSQALPAKKSKINFLSQHHLSLRYDQLLILTIGFLCIGVTLFCLGVEKGKSFAIEEMSAQRTKHQKVVQELGQKIFEKETRQVTKKETPVKQVEETKPVIEKKVPAPVPPKKPQAEPIEILDEIKKPQFTIQMVTYKTEQAAHKLIQKMTSKGHKTYLIPSGKYVQVSLGAFESRSMAKRTLRKLKADGVVPADAYVRTLPH